MGLLFMDIVQAEMLMAYFLDYFPKDIFIVNSLER